MSRYTKEHYEDVANILHNHNLRDSCEDALAGECRACNVTDALSHDFADLFAADNPRICTFHLTSEHNKDVERDEGCEMVGFNREQFLEACGLEPADCPICHGPPDGHTHLRQDSKGDS